MMKVTRPVPREAAVWERMPAQMPVLRNQSAASSAAVTPPAFILPSSASRMGWPASHSTSQKTPPTAPPITAAKMPPRSPGLHTASAAATPTAKWVLLIMGE